MGGVQMVSLLLVEDNESLRKLMRIHLQRAGYEVFEAGNGLEALAVLEHHTVDLMVLDIMMPHMDGYELTGELRGANYTLPILMVTAKDSLDDKREGFQKGADDYMVKPIDMDEMLLRVEALLRRSHISGKNEMRIGECLLEEESLLVMYREQKVSLRQKEFSLLHKLLCYPNKIFTRQTLMDEIWGYDCDADPRTVDVHIKRLREKLQAVPAFDIQTVRGLGYRAVVKE
jgi:two-component system, OmpR family, response regulator